MKSPYSKPENRTFRALLATTLFCLQTVMSTQPARTQTINPSVIDPTNTYAGKTYSEWAAGFWQYYTSLPSTNNPFYRHPSYPAVPLSTGQSGPVWFVCGNYLPAVSYTYTDSIPGGVALFVAITAAERDNASCPPTSFTEAQLRADAASAENGAANMSCTIDGVAIKGLTNVLTTPYRVQSTAFNYTCPSVHNILYDVFNQTCYQNNTGTSYTINGAIANGVFLLLAPLSAGNHTIHGTWAFPAFGLSASWTRNITVLPVALTVSANTQPGNLDLSWPQTPDNYAVQTTPSLSPPDWQPANLVVTTTNGIHQATASVGTTNQFFRLRLN